MFSTDSVIAAMTYFPLLREEYARSSAWINELILKL